MTQHKPLERDELARRVSRDIQSGWYVNLGIGIPTLVANHVPADREVIFHSENGIVGVGPAPAPDAVDEWLINAGKQHVTLATGGAYVDQSDSFAMIRGGHLDLTVLGAYEVSQTGDLANWSTGSIEVPPGVGGAMDLAVGARQVWVVMEHTTRSGGFRLVEKCGYPLTGARVVTRIYTDLAILEPCQTGFRLIESTAGISVAELQALTGAALHQ